MVFAMIHCTNNILLFIVLVMFLSLFSKSTFVALSRPLLAGFDKVPREVRTLVKHSFKNEVINARVF